MWQVSQSGVGGSPRDIGVADPLLSRDLHHRPRPQCFDPSQSKGDVRLYNLGRERNFTEVCQEVSGRADRLYDRHAHLGPNNDPARACPFLRQAQDRCIVPGGALAEDGKRFHKSGKSYLFDAKKLSAQFRDRLCRRIKKLNKREKLTLVGAAAEVNVGQMVKEMLAKKWEVFIQAFEDVENLYTYLSRYVHQVAISNHRILNIDRQAKTVTFRYKDNKDGGQEKEMTLSAETFIGRFLWHVLPRQFHRIRHFGLHSSGCRKKLSRVRELLGLEKEIPAVEKPSLSGWLEELFGEDILNKCPYCGGLNMSRRGQYDSFNPAQMELINYAIQNTAKREPAAMA